MKNIRLFFFLLLIQLIPNISFGQSKSLDDTLKKHNSFFIEDNFAIGMTRVNTNYTIFTNDNNAFILKKNNYLPCLEWFTNFGWKLDNKYGAFDIIKLGIGITSRSVNLIDTSGIDLRFKETYLQIPLHIGATLPLKFKNGRTHSIEAIVGIYAATPISNRLDLKDNLDSPYSNDCFGKFIRYGESVELAYTSFVKKHHGIKLGLRFSTDFHSITKFSNTKYQIYPYYISYAFFLSIVNFKKI